MTIPPKPASYSGTDRQICGREGIGLHKRIHRRTRPTGQFPRIVGVRVQPDMAKQIDDWRRRQDDLPGRPEAIRRMVELGDYILPPNDTGKDNMIGLNPLQKKDRVYVTKEIAGAMWFASRSDSPMVYEVTPEGGLDPDHKRKGISVACPKAKIIALHNVPDSVARRNRLQMLS
jgi:hypothetical protein